MQFTNSFALIRSPLLAGRFFPAVLLPAFVEFRAALGKNEHVELTPLPAFATRALRGGQKCSLDLTQVLELLVASEGLEPPTKGL